MGGAPTRRSRSGRGPTHLSRGFSRTANHGHPAFTKEKNRQLPIDAVMAIGEQRYKKHPPWLVQRQQVIANAYILKQNSTPNTFLTTKKPGQDKTCGFLQWATYSSGQTLKHTYNSNVSTRAFQCFMEIWFYDTKSFRTKKNIVYTKFNNFRSKSELHYSNSTQSSRSHVRMLFLGRNEQYLSVSCPNHSSDTPYSVHHAITHCPLSSRR